MWITLTAYFFIGVLLFYFAYYKNNINNIDNSSDYSAIYSLWITLFCFYKLISCFLIRSVYKALFCSVKAGDDACG